jgi:hypothetical protein
MQVTEITTGTVLTFTEDITFVTPSWANLTVGTHYVPVYAQWVLNLVRVIPAAEWQDCP